ncbi:MAG: glycosyltransferase [Clostridia bacterium]|nr:glycosyltransferase [Clostridia bacterium]
MKTVKLQNLLFPHDVDINIQAYPELIYHSTNSKKVNSILFDSENGSHVLLKNKGYDFGAYLNVLSLGKWKNFTYAKNFRLVLKVKGKATIELYDLYRNSRNVNRSILAELSVNTNEEEEIVINVPGTNSDLVAFRITAFSSFEIYSGYWCADVEDEELRRVRISIATTTFRKEEYIKKNVQMLKDKVLSSDEMKDSLFVNVVDNGRTLSPEEINGTNIRLIPNPNVGGSGGYSKGMLESLALEDKPTHVLLMDDDVLIMSEAIFRTFYLLRILKPEHNDRFVSGAMFDYDTRNIQYEDVGYVHADDGSYSPVKERMNMNKVRNLLKNEEMSKIERPNMYAGWWYCCIPTHIIEKNGVSLPLFVRGDDVEFSLRNNAKFITLDGICIWHVGFAGKFNAAMELYQVHRNSLAFQAISGVVPEINFYSRIRRMFWVELTRFSYDNCEQLLDSIDDFMKGPEFLNNLNGEKCLKEHSAKNEKFRSMNEFPGSYSIKAKIENQEVYDYEKLNIIGKLWYVCTLNGHIWPNFLLRNYPMVIAFDWFNVPGKNVMRKRLLAVNPHDKTAYLREINRKRCFGLLARYRKVMGNYRKNHASVEAAYRAEFTKVTGREFWEDYLRNQSNG